jgi:hypothetical protein
MTVAVLIALAVALAIAGRLLRAAIRVALLVALTVLLALVAHHGTRPTGHRPVAPRPAPVGRPQH